MFIRNATISDLNVIVSVHKESFKGFFLTELGGKFLYILYKAFAIGSGGVLRVLCNNDGNIIGFAAGALCPNSFFKELRRSKGFIFLLFAIPLFFKKPCLLVKKLWYALFYNGSAPLSIPNSALLSSICITTSFKGLSYGKMLLCDFEEIAINNGKSYLVLETDKYFNDNVLNFYYKNGYVFSSEFTQAGGRIMFQLIKPL